MRLLAYRTKLKRGKVLLQESTRYQTHSNNPFILFRFLFTPQGDTETASRDDSCIRVAWDLDAFVAPILKLFEERQCRKLQTTARLYFAPFNIFYIPGKVFSITHIPTKQRVSFYDIAQYFPELDEPRRLYEVQMLAELLYKELKKMGLEPTKLTSPVKIWEECTLSKLNLPTMADMPKEVALYASQCAGRAWVEAMQLGYFKRARDYDLSSAYSSVSKELIDFRVCRWAESNQYQPGAVYGYAFCEVTIYDWVMVHPITYEAENGSIETRTGTWPRKCTKDELDFIDKWGIGEYKIKSGHWCIPPRHKGELPKPLKLSTERLLEYKLKTGLQAALAKRMSMFHGKFGQETKDGFGEFYNPVWDVETQTPVRLQVAEWLYSHGIGPRRNRGLSKLLHISVDGVLLSTPAELGEDGQWRLSYSGEALILSSGLVYFADKKPKGLTIEDILGMIQEHPRVGYYEKRLQRRVTLADALSLGKFEELGEEKDMVSAVDFYRLEHDREFTKLPQTGGALLKHRYHSVPRRV